MLKAQTVLCWEARDPRFLLETSLPWGLRAHVKSHSHLLLPQPAAEQKASAVRFHEEQCPLLPFTEGPGSSWTILGETSHLPISPLLMVFSPCLEESLVVFVRLVDDKMGVWYGCGRKRTPLEILVFLFPECLQVLSCILQVLFLFLLVYSFVFLFTCKPLKIFFPFKKSTCSLFYPISCAEKVMAPHSSTLAWKIPWMEESGRLKCMGSQRVGHDWVTSLFFHCGLKALIGLSSVLWSIAPCCLVGKKMLHEPHFKK